MKTNNSLKYVVCLFVFQKAIPWKSGLLLWEDGTFSSFCVIWSSNLVQNFMPHLNELLSR